MGAKHKFILYLFITISLTCHLLQSGEFVSREFVSREFVSREFVSGEFVAALSVTVCLSCYHSNCESILALFVFLELYEYIILK